MASLNASLSSLSVLEHQLEEELRSLVIPQHPKDTSSRIPQPHARVPRLRTRKNPAKKEKKIDGDEFLLALAEYAKQEDATPAQARPSPSPTNCLEALSACQAYERKRTKALVALFDTIGHLSTGSKDARRCLPVAVGRPLFSGASLPKENALPDRSEQSVSVVIRNVEVNLNGSRLAFLLVRGGEYYRDAAQLPCRWSQRLNLLNPLQRYRMVCGEAESYRVAILDRSAVVGLSDTFKSGGRVFFKDIRGHPLGYAETAICAEGTTYCLTVTPLEIGLHRKNFAPLKGMWPLLCLDGEHPLDILFNNPTRRASMSRVADSVELRSKSVVIERDEPFTSFAVFVVCGDNKVVGGTEELLIEDDDYDCEERCVEVDLFDEACVNKMGFVSLRVKVDKRS
ncbi:hypothetical protein FOL47_006534 [Perkinsus chesapeaki]|uniref:Uncharacterized protein n=1 Tax=Perkinsus chesapeaki TaxID=330153 RepID=A0A7J6LRG6_PERCH|nr:hypothetical protein FOL47_006534 [Perkinsus chesapeaki]